jgi:hypothetical protein
VIRVLSYFIFLFSLLNRQFGHAQNLVPNPSFEETDSCVYTYHSICAAQPWFQPRIDQGDVCASSSSELFNSCCAACPVRIPDSNFGYQFARTGQNHAGIGVYVDTFNIREYIEVTLDSPLIAGQGYCLTFYVSLGDIHNSATSSIQAYLSPDSLLRGNMKAIDDVSPQVVNHPTNFLSDKDLWMQISGSFFAQGGERYLTIGNFNPPATTPLQVVAGGEVNGIIYYFIDDISLTACTNASLSENNFDTFAELIQKPGELQVTLNRQLKQPVLRIYDTFGRVIKMLPLQNGGTSNIDVSEFSSGIYFLQLCDNKEIVAGKKVLIN